MSVKRPPGSVAADVSALVREREGLVARLSVVDKELVNVRRALGLGADQEQRECEACHNEFQVTRHDQRLCRPCRATSPGRSTDHVKDLRTAGALVEITCHGVGSDDDHVACEKTVQKPNNRRGPLRCPDCTLAQKRHNTKKSLRLTAKRKHATLSRIKAAAPLPPVTSDSATPTMKQCLGVGGMAMPNYLSCERQLLKVGPVRCEKCTKGHIQRRRNTTAVSVSKDDRHHDSTETPGLRQPTSPRAERTTIPPLRTKDLRNRSEESEFETVWTPSAGALSLRDLRGSESE